MKRPRLRVTVEGAPGPRDRALRSLEEMGYRVVRVCALPGKRIAAELLAPHGEV